MFTSNTVIETRSARRFWKVYPTKASKPTPVSQTPYLVRIEIPCHATLGTAI